MKMKKKPQFSDELLDQIIADDMLGGDWTPIQNKLDGIKAALMERMLRGEMTHHLGYPAGEDAPTGISNRRNGTSEKTLQTDSGEVTIQIPGIVWEILIPSSSRNTSAGCRILTRRSSPFMRAAFRPRTSSATSTRFIKQRFRPN